MINSILGFYLLSFDMHQESVFNYFKLNNTKTNSTRTFNYLLYPYMQVFESIYTLCLSFYMNEKVHILAPINTNCKENAAI